MKDYNELIEAYLRDELQGEEKINFETQLSKDEALRNSFNLAKEVSLAFRHQELESKLEFVKSLEKEQPISGAQKKNKWFWLMIPFIIALLVGIYLNNEKKPQPIPQHVSLFEVKNFDKYILHSTIRSPQSDKYSIEQKKAYGLYAAQSFKNAIPLLSDLWKNQTDTLALYYLGISYLGIDDYNEAKSILTRNELSEMKNPILEID